MKNLIKSCTKCHSERNHAVAKSKNLGRCVIASLVRGAAISCLLFLAACGDDSSKTAGGTEEDAGIIAIENKTVSGVSQKGPFVNGSSVTVYGLDGETLAQTGNIYEGKIRSDMGDFSVKVVKLASQYALLKANGFYRNEVTGEKSNSQMTLYALTDLSDRDEVNVNLLTHLAYERSLYLATNSMSVANAKKQAEAEVFKSFEIEGDFEFAEDLNIFGENDQSAALLAMSVLMQGDLKEADFSERLDNYARDIESDGIWDDKNTATAIADWASEKSLSGGLASVRANVGKWGQLFGVPPFEKYVNNFWWQNYGLGICNSKREGEVQQNANPLSANNGVHFICNNGDWRVATDLEKDTYKWKAGKDADVKFGDVVKSNCYVFEDKAWRSGNESDCSLDLHGCTALRQGSVGLGKDKVWYICDMKSWREATNIEKDTATWGAGKFDGEVRAGQINKTIYYIYETSKKAWHNATTIEKDTYNYEKNASWTNGKDGEKRKGALTDSMYVFDSSSWRYLTALEEKNGLCTKNLQDKIISDDSTFYLCFNKNWNEVKEDNLCPELESKSVYLGEGFFPAYYTCLDSVWHSSTSNIFYLYGPCTEQRNGDTATAKNYQSAWWGPDAFYVCENKEWVEKTKEQYLLELKFPKTSFFNDKIKYGILSDERNEKDYKTVTIGKQTWMAENLNYPDCDDYFGCAYSWSEAMNISGDCNSSRCTIQEPHQGVCPEGWHIPSGNEWETLFNGVGKINYAMMSTALWTKKTTNESGFSIIPAPDPWGGQSQSFHWSATQYDDENAMQWYVSDGTEGENKADLGHNSKEYKFYVRCVKDEK